MEDYVLSHTSYLLRLTVNYTHIIFLYGIMVGCFFIGE